MIGVIVEADLGAQWLDLVTLALDLINVVLVAPIFNDGGGGRERIWDLQVRISHLVHRI